MRAAPDWEPQTTGWVQAAGCDNPVLALCLEPQHQEDGSEDGALTPGTCVLEFFHSEDAVSAGAGRDPPGPFHSPGPWPELVRPPEGDPRRWPCLLVSVWLPVVGKQGVGPTGREASPDSRDTSPHLGGPEGV